MPKHPVTSPQVHEPPGGGTYSQGFVATGGRTVYVAGMTARDKNGEVVGVGDLRVQTTQVLENMKAVLAAAGATMGDVVKLTVFMRDLSQSAIVREIRQQYFTKPYPASTLVEISRLADERFLIEIEAVAVVD
jgi:2-iminobutanoate/2-iminopropanoate deaminase